MSPGAFFLPRALRATLPLALLLLLAPGCETFQSAFGGKLDLKGKPVQRLEAEVRGGSTLCPGAATPLVVTAILDDGTRLVSKGAGGGKLAWDSFQFQTTGAVTVSREGQLTLDPDPQRLTAEPLGVRIAALAPSGAAVEVPLSARYDCAFTADFSGRPGRDGDDGGSGVSGAHGEDARAREQALVPRRNGQGGAGVPGSNGGTGEPGQSADNVEVEVSLAGSAERPLLQVLARGESGGRLHRFLVDPQGGTLTIRANGGKGGNGGRGGRGGDGGRGGNNIYTSTGGDGGNGGFGGDGGNGGNGGRIRVHLTPEASRYQHLLRFENRGGLGGSAGTGGLGGNSGMSGGSTSGSPLMGSQGRKGASGPAGQAGKNGNAGPAVDFQREPPRVSNAGDASSPR